MAGAEPVWKSTSESGSAWGLTYGHRTDRGAHGEAHGGADERAHWACARPSSGVFNLTSTTHTPVHGVLSRARARLCLAGRGIGPNTSESFQMQAYPAWGHVGTLGAVAALNNNPQVVIRQLQSISGNQSAIIRNNPSATIQPQQSATIHPQQIHPQQSIRNNPQQFIRNSQQLSATIRNNPTATIHPQSSIRNNPSATTHP